MSFLRRGLSESLRLNAEQTPAADSPLPVLDSDILGVFDAALLKMLKNQTVVKIHIHRFKGGILATFALALSCTIYVKQL